MQPISKSADAPHELLVVSHVKHYQHDGKFYAYGPYVREINVWCDLFPQVTIAAPRIDATPPGDCLPFSHASIAIKPIRQCGGRTVTAKLKQLFLLPLVLFQLARAMKGVDAIHVRCPGNIGMFGTLLAPLFCKKLIAKYAGQWSGYPGEAKSVRFQRWLLGSSWWKGPVTVYGQWAGQPEHVVPFFTSVVTADQLGRADQKQRSAVSTTPSVLFVGRLSKAKNVDALIRAIGKLAAAGTRLPCRIVGEGSEQKDLKLLAELEGVADLVRFEGGVDFDQVLEFYRQSDVLVLVSETEGWPKAIAEAMAFGLVCIGSDRGLVPWLLDNRGYVIEPGDVDALADRLQAIAESPQTRIEMSQRAFEFGQQYSLEGLREALRKLMNDSWQVSIPSVE